MPETCIHATCVDVDGHGILILGRPGSGKSDLALRLIDEPGCGLTGVERRSFLVADDQVVIERTSFGIVARPPAALEGRIEVRGIGILDIAFHAETTLCLLVRLMDASAIDRMPGPGEGVEDVLGVTLPLARIDPRHASAPARVRAALDSIAAVANPSQLTLSTGQLLSPTAAD
jgi:HPr kinase/phosphorylase